LLTGASGGVAGAGWAAGAGGCGSHRHRPSLLPSSPGAGRD